MFDKFFGPRYHHAELGSGLAVVFAADAPVEVAADPGGAAGGKRLAVRVPVAAALRADLRAAAAAAAALASRCAGLLEN